MAVDAFVILRLDLSSSQLILHTLADLMFSINMGLKFSTNVSLMFSTNAILMFSTN